MARPLRINVAGGWYHITARGNNRQAIFCDKRDREHFLELLEEMGPRFDVRVHAYVLMDNHYHLLIMTPQANASRAVQWLNVSYSVWWNIRQQRSGHVFQGRFKAILVEGSGWAVPLSQYIHFNPVAIKGLGMSKAEKGAEGLGLKSPSPELAARRLALLRTYPWSSYRAYAGYEKKPEWLDAAPVLRRVRAGSAGYRQQTERRLCGAAQASLWSHAKWGAVLGSERFAQRVRDGLKAERETAGQRALRRRRAFDEVVGIVERIKGERWAQFRDRQGDWGRDLALWVARRCTGLTLAQLGQQAGGMDYTAVAMAIRRFADRASKDSALQQVQRHAEIQCAK